MAQATNSPQVRFVERTGTTLIEDLGRSNPWASEWYCPRKDCLPCQGRAFLAQEETEEATKLVAGGESPEKAKRKAKAGERKACTSEGNNYILECITCRKEDVRRAYLGETSRSPYQRGKEHSKKIREGNAAHPMVINSVEEHGGVGSQS